MRSRFTAFCLGSVDHLSRTWAVDSRPKAINVDPGRQWLGLEIIDVVDGRELSSHGIVEFKASWSKGTHSGVVHERSTFRRNKGQWVYVGPEIRDGGIGAAVALPGR